MIINKNFYILYLWIFFIFLSIFPFNPFAQNLSAQNIDFPVFFSLSDYIELICPYAFVFTSQTGFYGIADQLYFSFFGNNHEYNQFFIDGFKLNSHFFPGTPIWDFYLNIIRIDIDPFHSSINGKLSIPAGLSINTYTFFSGIWGIFPFTEELVYYLSGSLAAIARNPISINDRRKLKYLFGFNLYYNNGEDEGENLQFTINFSNGVRTFLSYGIDSEKNTIYSVFQENFTKLQFLLFYSLSPYMNLFSSFFYNFRTNYGSEFYFSSDQTKILNSFSLILGIGLTNNSYMSNISIQLENNNIDSEKSNYDYELIDFDGESMEFFLPDGNNFDLSLIVNFKYFKFNNFIINFDSDTNISIYQPNANKFTINLLYYNEPFGKIVFDTYSTYWITSNSDLCVEYKIKNEFIDFSSSAILGFSFLYLKDSNFNNLLFLSFDFNSTIIFFPQSIFNISLNLGKNTPSITSTLAKNINSNYLSGSYYNSTDQMLFHTDGIINSISENLKQPTFYYISISFSYKNKNNFYFNLDTQFKSFQNLFWIRANDSGFFSSYTYNNQTLYYITDSDISYVLTNYWDAINWLIENNLLNENYFDSIPDFLKSPFYLGLVLSIGKKTESFFINFSFWAYMVVGIGTIGNSLLEDEIGVISETQADPNNYIYGIGRMISDRSYVFKFNIGFKLLESIWLKLIIRYKDGQPFTAFYESVTPNNYLVIYNQLMSGDNPFSASMGRREDCIWEFNFYLSGKFYLFGKEWEISIIFYNFLDLAFELTENVFNISHRQPLEFQVPGTISLQLSLFF